MLIQTAKCIVPMLASFFPAQRGTYGKADRLRALYMLDTHHTNCYIITKWFTVKIHQYYYVYVPYIVFTPCRNETQGLIIWIAYVKN